MGFDDAQIIFDNAKPGNSFYPGQAIEGKIVFRQDKVKTLRGFFVKLKGRCKVRWTTGGGKSRRTHTAHEEYVKQQLYLMGGPDGEMQLPPGNHIFPFVLHLPANCPPSFESKTGNIKYKLKFVIDRPFKFDQTLEHEIRVLSMKDLNADPKCKEPLQMRFEKDFSCCCISFGTCDCEVTAPVTGYCPGQTLRCQAKFNNDSTVVIDYVSFQIVERWTYHAQNTERTRQKKTVLALVQKGTPEGIVPRTARSWPVELAIPIATQLYNMDACSFIDVVYELKVVLYPAGCQSVERYRRPIILGQIPLRDSEVDSTAQTTMEEPPPYPIDSSNEVYIPLLPQPVPYVPPTPMSPYYNDSGPEKSIPETEGKEKSAESP